MPEFADEGVTKAVFRIGADGLVGEFGMVYDPSMWDEMIWFRKVG